MSIKSPLCLYGGQMKELQSGDLLPVHSMGNGSRYENNTIWGKAALSVDNYQTPNPSPQFYLTFPFIPHFMGIKSASAYQGLIWSWFGGCKGSAAANSSNNIRYFEELNGLTIGTGTSVNAVNTLYRYFVLGAHNGSLAGMKAKTGTYTGNLTDNQSYVINGNDDFDIIFIKARNAQYGVLKTKDHVGEACSFFLYPSADLATNSIQKLGDLGGGQHGFQIGTHAAVNSSGVIYDWFAFKSDSSGSTEMAVTSYIGRGGEAQHVWLPWKSSIIIGIPNGALNCFFWTDRMNNDYPVEYTSIISAATASVNNGILKAVQNGFWISDNAMVNTANNVVNILAIKCDL